MVIKKSRRTMEQKAVLYEYIIYDGDNIQEVQKMVGITCSMGKRKTLSFVHMEELGGHIILKRKMNADVGDVVCRRNDYINVYTARQFQDRFAPTGRKSAEGYDTASPRQCLAELASDFRPGSACVHNTKKNESKAVYPIPEQTTTKPVLKIIKVEVEMVECAVCGKKHPIDCDNYATVLGNLTLSHDKKIVADNVDIDHRVLNYVVFCVDCLVEKLHGHQYPKRDR